MNKEEEIVELCINYGGTEFTVFVPFTTANILVNDPEAANKYIEEHCLNNNSNSVTFVNESDEETAAETNEELDGEEPSTSASSISENNNDAVIWSSKSKKNEEDHEATKLLLQLRSKYAHKFNDKKTIKNTLWHKMALEIKENGYNIGEGGAEKCRQKFANLQKQYLKHIKHVRTTGPDKKEPPPYFEEMHSILGSKDKVDPKNLQDSLASISECDNSNSSHASDAVNRFTVKTAKPKSSNTQLLEYMKEESKKEREDRDRHFKVVEKLLETQNQQREKLLELLGEVVKSKKKRQHED